MSDRGIVYDVRRQLQRIAYDIFGAEFMSKVYFRIVMHQKLNLENPQTLNEKMQWYKLNYCVKNPLVPLCADKYRIREYLEKKGLMEYAIPLIGFWENAEDIPWEDLPNQFAIKCNHGCAYNIICKDKSKFDTKAAAAKLNRWVKEDFGKFNAEPHYDQIKKGIVCEKYLGDGKEDFLVDYKFYCFNGQPAFVLICYDRTMNRHNEICYDLDWKPYNILKNPADPVERPSCFEEMIRVSRVASEDFPFVRVDFYVYHDRPIIGELTFVSDGGMDSGITYEADVELGKKMQLD